MVLVQLTRAFHLAPLAPLTPIVAGVRLPVRRFRENLESQW